MFFLVNNLKNVDKLYNHFDYNKGTATAVNGYYLQIPSDTSTQVNVLLKF